MSETTEPFTIERVMPAAPERVWELWTSARGIERWWAPDGFSVAVQTLDLRPGGELVYAMTAQAAEQVAFMEQAGMPLTTVSHKRFTVVQAPRRLSYDSLVDFVPGVDPYWQLTEVELNPDGRSTRVAMRMAPLHDAVWTERLVAGRGNELANLERILRG